MTWHLFGVIMFTLVMLCLVASLAAFVDAFTGWWKEGRP